MSRRRLGDAWLTRSSAAVGGDMLFGKVQTARTADHVTQQWRCPAGGQQLGHGAAGGEQQRPGEELGRDTAYTSKQNRSSERINSVTEANTSCD